ncbi:hypothetical protein AB6A40_008547 [Gnathostoma spinigerum]|uniref:PAX-interacting protein 1 n=1 Tax=Gnathostoma spinigerum TaxID=75299 RepID=A0ABD6EXN6_9BILA
MLRLSSNMYPSTNNGTQTSQPPQQFSPAAAPPDMRSPPVMSPTQAAIVPNPQQAGPSPINSSTASNGTPIHRSVDLQSNGAQMGAQQHMRVVPQSTTPFYGHEPNIAGSVQSDMCLVGCYFAVIDYEKMLLDRFDVQDITAVIRMHGGDIDFGPRAYSNERVTHVICESLRSPQVQQALKERKRCITMYWLNDTMAKKRFEAPWRAFHLPTFWTDNQRPALGKLIAINGFDPSECAGVKMMISAIGARFTPHITKQNNFLVSKSCEGRKVEKCRELGITIVNYTWLVELYLGLKSTLVDNDASYYPLPGNVFEVNTPPCNLELYSESCKTLMGEDMD